MSDDPSHKLVIDAREGYLRVVYGGDRLTLESILYFVNGVAKQIREGGYSRVLLIREAPLLESDEARSMVSAMVRNLLGQKVRFAIVDNYGNDPVAARRAADASRAAGWDLWPFDSEDEAVEWLTGE